MTNDEIKFFPYKTRKVFLKATKKAAEQRLRDFVDFPEVIANSQETIQMCDQALAAEGR